MCRQYTCVAGTSKTPNWSTCSWQVQGTSKVVIAWLPTFSSSPGHQCPILHAAEVRRAWTHHSTNVPATASVIPTPRQHWPSASDLLPITTESGQYSRSTRLISTISTERRQLGGAVRDGGSSWQWCWAASFWAVSATLVSTSTKSRTVSTYLFTHTHFCSYFRLIFSFFLLTLEIPGGT